MLTWQADDGHGLEGARVSFAHGLRAQGRMVRPDFTASYRLVVDENGLLSRLSVTSDTAARERNLTMNRTGDGYWLLDAGRGDGGTRSELDGAADVDLAYSPLFNTLPIRRLGLHREPAEHTLAMVFVTLPELEVQAVRQTYRTVSTAGAGAETGDDHGVVAFSWADFHAELVVDPDGLVLSYPGVATRLTRNDATAH